MAQQRGKVVETATSLVQYALSTKAGTECIARAHALQTLIDGISAYDLISRAAMFHGLSRVEGGKFQCCPLSGCSTGLRQNILWEDDSGRDDAIAPLPSDPRPVA